MSRRLATVVDYHGLQRAMRARKDELNISNATVDEIAGLSDGRANKLLADPPLKNLGITSLGALLSALALRLVVVEDEQQLRRIAPRLVQRTRNQIRHRKRCDPMLEAAAHE